MVNFLNKGEEFLSYKRPLHEIDDANILTDVAKRNELVKRHALGSSIIYSQQQTLPFKNNPQDRQLLRAYELKYL